MWVNVCAFVFPARVCVCVGLLHTCVCPWAEPCGVPCLACMSGVLSAGREDIYVMSACINLSCGCNTHTRANRGGTHVPRSPQLPVTRLRRVKGRAGEYEYVRTPFLKIVIAESREGRGWMFICFFKSISVRSPVEPHAIESNTSSGFSGIFPPWGKVVGWVGVKRITSRCGAAWIDMSFILPHSRVWRCDLSLSGRERETYWSIIQSFNDFRSFNIYYKREGTKGVWINP